MKRSIWTKDLYDTFLGRILSGYVFPALFLYEGVSAIATKQVSWRSADFDGVDALCLGGVFFSLGFLTLFGVHFQPHSERGRTTKKGVSILLMCSLIICTGILLVRSLGIIGLP